MQGRPSSGRGSRRASIIGPNSLPPTAYPRPSRWSDRARNSRRVDRAEAGLTVAGRPLGWRATLAQPEPAQVPTLIGEPGAVEGRRAELHAARVHREPPAVGPSKE